MSYTPNYTGNDLALAQELLRISQVLNELHEKVFPTIYKVPDKPRQGMVRYADGTEWNPGSGEGLYVYDGSAWDLLNGGGGGGGASQLIDLSDVSSATKTNRFVLVADGANFASRALVEADVSDLGNYLENIAEDTTPQLGGTLDANGNVIQLADGSAASPSLQFKNSTNMGMYRKGANQIGLSIASTEILDVTTLAFTYQLPLFLASGTLNLAEQASASADNAGYGQFWVKNDTPNTAWFTDDAGNDIQLAAQSPWNSDINAAGFDLDDVTQIRANNGSAAAPSYSFDDDPSAGMYRIGANQLGFSVASTLIFDINTLGLSVSGNLTATQIGGITEANLLDKSATETVTGGWTFSGTLTVPEAAVTNHEAALTILESQITDGSVLARVGSAESISADWNWQDNKIERAELDDYSITSTTATVSANAVTCTYSTAQSYEVDLEAATGTVTITISGGPPAGTFGEMIIKVQQDTTADRQLTWAGGTFRWPGGTEVEPQTGADAITIYYLKTWDGGTIWYVDAVEYS